MILYPYRFRTLEDATKFIQSSPPDVSLIIPPFIKIDGGIKPNPEYQSAPYEQQVIYYGGNEATAVTRKSLTSRGVDPSLRSTETHVSDLISNQPYSMERNR